MTSRLRWTGMICVILHGSVLSEGTERLSVHHAISIALEKNASILAAQQHIEAAGGRVLQAGRIPNPEIGLNWNETPLNFNITESDERDIGIVQQIEFPTRRSGRIDVATYDKQIAELQLERIRMLITAQVKRAYYRARFSQEIIENFEEQLRLLHDVQRLLMDRYQAGSGDFLDVIRGKVEIARLNNDIIEARRELRTRKAQLNLLLGKNADTALELTDSLSYRPIHIAKDSLMRELVDKSMTLRISHHVVLREEAAVGLAQSSYLPDFSLGIFHQRRNEEPPFDANQFHGTTTNALGVQLGISVPLWFWHEPEGQVHEANALKEIAQVNNSEIARRVRSGILNALSALEVADAQINTFDRSLLTDVNDILATGIVQYQNNQIDLLNLLDVHRTARATRMEYSRALLNFAVALADLEVAGELPLDEQQ